MRTFEDDDPLFAPMLNALFAAFRGTAVMSGCAPSATGANRNVTVAAGSVQVGGATVAVAGGTVTLDAGGEFDRYDLVTVDAAGGLAVTKGTVERKCPAQPANTCLLAIVSVPAGATVIATGDVYDARMLASHLVAGQLTLAAGLDSSGKISPVSWLVILGGDPLLISKTHGSSTTVTFAQIEAGHGNVKVVVKGAATGPITGTRTFTVFKGETEIWSQAQASGWDGDTHRFTAFSATAFEDLAVATGDVLTISRTGGDGAVTVEIYATPCVAPYGIAT